MPTSRILLSWSSGKDSAWALHVLRSGGEYDVAGLVTTINERHERVAMHAVRTALLEAQAEAAGLPLWKIPIPDRSTNEQYEAAMHAVIERARREAVTGFAFGDLFLEDIRRYRERQLAGTGLTPVFPLWQQPTAALAEEMVKAGLRAVITCIDPKALPAEFAGRQFDGDFLRALPPGVDPCGENGEFHSFAYAGPMLSRALAVEVGERVERDGFVFADVRPSAAATQCS
jgi:uncharacterized protein (TIGR00290 family)